MRAGKPSRTAVQNALFRALEARRPVAARVADDPQAVAFLSPEFRALAEGARLPPVRRRIESFIDRRWPCVRPGVVARTRLIDETVRGELPGTDQVLILGAGFDSRPYRLEDMARTTVFEVDHPDTQRVKRRVLVRRGENVDRVRFVPVTFGSDDPAERLTDAGFRADVRSLVLWEGVTNYLDPTSVAETFGFLAVALTAGSPVVFTYVDRAMLDGSADFAGSVTTMKAVAKVGEPFTFGLAPDEVPAYLAKAGFDLVWDTRVSDAARRYYPSEGSPAAPAYYHVVLARRQ
jgi:methyltransferase (TIGR00027 family)